MNLKEFELQSPSGLKLRFLNYAGAVTSLKVEDNEVIKGLGSIDNHLLDQASFGALVGRYANRIKEGKFTLDGQIFQLEQNNKGNHLHGGSKGLHRSFWTVEVVSKSHARLTHTLEDGVSGYQGNVKVTVDYLLTDQREWIIKYQAETDAATPINLTSHCYFNFGIPVDQHILTIHADEFVAIDELSIPLEDTPTPVEGTAFDFRQPTSLGDRFGSDHPQVKLARGFDHTFVRSHEMAEIPLPMALVKANGIEMEIFTTEPGVQLFTANFEEPIDFPDGTRIEAHCALCLETQHFPDSPNRSDFPNTILRPGEIYRSETIHRFKTY